MDAPAYPRHWEADVVLRDGSVAQLRPIRPEDSDGLVAFYSRVSEQSKYYRFFAAYPVLSRRDVARFTNVDYVQRLALVVTMRAEIVAVGRYDAVDGSDAEVAFLVQDDYQGRGLAQLLLEHLTEAARERGLSRFVADVLPSNERMIQVFHEQGYAVVDELSDGVLRLEFSIDPTDTAVGVMQAREHRAESASIDRMLNARSVAVVSDRQDTNGQVLVRNLVRGDFSGTVHAVNPQAEAVLGVPAFSSVQQIPGEVDLAVVTTPANLVPDVVLDCAAKGVHGLVVISSGNAWAGEAGRRRQRQLVRLARAHGLRLVGPDALGMINTAAAVQLNASLAARMPARGRVGFFCQSWALGFAVLETAERRGLGLSTFVSAGNRADVSGNDLLQYWEEDAATEVVLLYLESIGNPRKFSRIARRVGRRKPIVAVSAGRAGGTPAGDAVRRSAAPQAAVDALFRQAGIIRVDTLEELFDVGQLLAHQPLPRGPRVAVVGNSEALGRLATDAAEAAGLRVREPVTLGAGAPACNLEAALGAAIDDPGVDAVIAISIPPVNTSGAQFADVLVAAGEQSDKPIVSTFLAREGIPKLLRRAAGAGAAGRGAVPSYASPEAAVRTLAHVVEHAAWLARPAGHVPEFADVRAADARVLVWAVLDEHPEGSQLSQAQLRTLLAAYGIELWQHIPVATLEQATAAGRQLDWDVVLKATAPHLRSRPDLAYVWRNIADADGMQQAWTRLVGLGGDPDRSGLVVQRMASPGVPLSVGSSEDPLLGPVLSFGVRGAPSELLGDRSYRIPPLTDLDADSMVREIRSAPLLLGYRGAEVVDLAAVCELLQRLAQLKYDLPEVARLDLDLVLAGPAGSSVLEAGAAVAPNPQGRSDWYVRRMPSVGVGDTAATGASRP